MKTAEPTFVVRVMRAEEVGLLRAWVDQGAEWSTGVLLTPPKIEQQP